MKDYLANPDSFNELLQLMIENNVFTYGVTATGEKGYEYWFCEVMETQEIEGF